MAALGTTRRAHTVRALHLMMVAGFAALYIWLVFLPDPSLEWAATDEACCHTRTIRAIQDEGILAALGDSHRYRSATTPLYHLLMSIALDRVDPLAIRYGWTVITLFAGYLVYRRVADDTALHRRTGAALALTLAFMLSPTVRAAARYFVTDGLALYLAVAALLLLLRACATSRLSTPLALASIVVAFASFYTRQYYLWATLYVSYRVFATADRRIKLVTAIASILLSIPAVVIFTIWRGMAPPLGTPIHTTPLLMSTLPNAMGLLAIYALPLAWVALRDIIGQHSDVRYGNGVRLAVAVVCGAALYAVAWHVLGFEIPQEGGILRVFGRFGSFGALAFMAISYLGIVMLARWLIVDGWAQVWWGVFLLPLLTGTVLLQRYVEPAILVFMFFVARPRDALNVLDSPVVWFYPVFNVFYSVSRALYFTGGGG
jgi:hypothetical protein